MGFQTVISSSVIADTVVSRLGVDEVELERSGVLRPNDDESGVKNSASEN